MSLAEQDLKRAADLKLWIENRISELEADISRWRDVLTFVDSILKTSSFRRAAEITAPVKERIPAAEPETVVATRETGYQEVRPIKRSRDGRLLANAYISPSSLDIVLVSDVDLRVETPPFESFFVNRILEGMRSKDLEMVKSASLKESEVLRHELETRDGKIVRIAVFNYREKARLNEILNTASWAFSRMLEKS